MTSSFAFRRFVFAFGTAFAVLYAVALKFDLALSFVSSVKIRGKPSLMDGVSHSTLTSFP